MRREKVFTTELIHTLTEAGAWLYKIPDFPQAMLAGSAARFNPPKPVDLVGVFRGRFVCIECKASAGFDSIKMDWFRENQVATMDAVEERGGVSLVAINVRNKKRGASRVNRLYLFRWPLLVKHLQEFNSITPASLRNEQPFYEGYKERFPGLVEEFPDYI